MLDEIGVYYGQPQFSVILPKVWKVIAYAKERMRTFQPGILSVILQLKCPVQRKNHDDEFISLALGGNCPEELRLEICTVRCADELFGVENLANFSIFNCRVDCCIDTTTCRCAVCTLTEARFLGKVYQVMCKCAHAIGATMAYISMAGRSTGILEKVAPYLRNKHHDESPYFAITKFLPDGYHLSLLGYYCDKMGTVEQQVRTQR